MKLSSSVQTKNKKKIPKIIIRNKNQNNNSLSIYYFNILKNKKLIADFHQDLQIKQKFIKSNSTTMSIPKIKLNLCNKSSDFKNKDILPKISPYTFKYFYKESNKNNLHKSLSSIKVNSIEKDKNNLESNFMKIQKDSNIYTSNADYIKNKKLVILDKYIYDKNKYMPDRLGLFDMSSIPHSKKQKGKGVFGKIYYNHNKYNGRQKENLNKDIII